MKIVNGVDSSYLKRSVDAGTEEQRIIVKDIIANVKNAGDKALKEYTLKFDQADLSSLLVSEEELEAAYEDVDKEMVAIIEEAAENIRSYHQNQLKTSWMGTKEDGTILGQKITPLDSVGVYVPGGTAAYPSSVLMNVVPAKVAGVARIVMVSPPNADGKLPSAVLVAAHIAGVKEIYKAGGAQAVADRKSVV